MNCPRCKAPLASPTDPDTIITCSGCGARLVTRPSRAKQPTTPPPPTPSPALRTPPPPGPHPAAPLPPSAAPAADRPPSLAETLEALVREVRALRQGQERVLALLESRDATLGGDEDEQAPALAPIRAGSRKSVVLIDDDPATREAALAELKRADVPVRAFTDGNSAISGIAEQKPDVIVLELGLDGQMAGKDVINMIKATMEWVDIPIVLWTRMGVANQKEARQVHGADELVPKTAGTGALVGRVINIFRRG